MQAEAVYQTLFWVGALGIGTMSALGAAARGASHGHGVGGHGAHGTVGHGHGAAGHGHAVVGHGHGAHAPTTASAHTATGGAHPPHDPAVAAHGTSPSAGAGHAHGGTHTGNAGSGADMVSAMLGVLSPMTLFSVALGAGATGVLLRDQYTPILTAFLALLAGFALFLLVVRPVTRFAQRFITDPATTLAGAVATEAVAQNRFDGIGRGIVSVTIDGQIVRLLAHLERDDFARGVGVAPGERLVVTQIDEAKNSCHVTKL